MGRLVGRVLRAAGVDAVYGAPLAGVRVAAVDDPGVATVMAGAHARVHGHPAAVHRGDGTIVVGGHGGDPPEVEAASAEDLLAAVEAVQAAARGAGPGVGLRIVVDPEAPAPDILPDPPPPPDRWSPPDEDLVARLTSAARPVILAGPGVVRDGAVPGLHALAAAAGLGVLNTWGAKGMFDWRSRHHLATAGLQAHDFELGGLADADVVVATGVDPAEAPPGRWRHLAPAVEVAPGALGPLAEVWSRPAAAIAVPPLRAGLARVTQEGWSSTGAPLAPSLVTRHYAAEVGAAGLVAADPGVAGYWVARTFATTTLGSVAVPGSGGPGFAVACAAVARLRSPDRPVLAVVDGPAGDAVEAALDAGRRLGVRVPVEAWWPGGEALDADAHRARLRRLVHGDAPAVAGLATDGRQLDRMVAVAGPVVAWRA
ncbi:MAG TPA: hypothetical protein VFZ77_22385 [Acidimicrobiales bacterium]